MHLHKWADVICVCEKVEGGGGRGEEVLGVM